MREDVVVSETQIIVVLVVGAVVLAVLACLTLIVLLRLRRVVRSQFEALDKMVSTLRATRGGDTPREPGDK